METAYKIVTLGDVHWDAPDLPPELLEREFDTILLPWLRTNSFDALIQSGDWFDRRMSLDSASSKIAIRMLVKLCQICQERNVPFRIIKGTLSHDYTQLINYKPLETEYSMFRIISSADTEELLPDFDVLWMPEEYPTDYSDFYSKFFFDGDGNPKVYDGIFGHGEIDVAANWSSMNESERHYGGTPCHEGAFLLESCSGPVWFGHIHKEFVYKKRLGYPGTFSRWIFGEETDKGFDILTVSKKDSQEMWKVSREKVVNTLAREYTTYTLAQLASVSDSLDEIIVKIRAAVGTAYKIRVMVEDFPLSVEDLSVLRGSLVSDRNIVIVSVARAVTSTITADETANDNDTQQVVLQERAQRLAYLRDVNVPSEERLLRYLKERYPDQDEVTLDDVRQLTAPI